MITKAYILEINQQSNKYKVRIPIFEKPGLSTENSKLSNTTFYATLSHEPTSNQSYNVGDCVFVGFENNQHNRPIILGKLYTVNEVENKTGAINSKSLLIYDKAILPADTTIGNIDFGNISNFFNRINDVINNKDLFVDSIQFSTQNEGAGLVSFDDDEGVLEVSLSPNVILDIGIDDVIKVYNDTTETLTYAQAVYNSGVVTATDKFKVKLTHASNHTLSDNILGLVTEPILSGQYGFVKRRGLISNVLIPPSVYSVNQKIYLAPQESGLPDGRFTKTRPVPPDFITEIGFVTKLSSNDTTPDGQVYVDIHVIPISSDISYDNTSAELSSQTVKGALDELSLGKVDIGALSSNINLYATTTSSSISGYFKLVTDVSDPAYNSSAVDVSTGIINNSRLIASLVSEPNLFVGTPGVINITTIGNIKRTAGNNNQYAAFYFEVYKRTSGGTETLLSTSNETPDIIIANIYEEFSASSLTNFGTFTATDRVVIKFLANMTGNAGSSYDFQFGGLNPVRTLLPVPVSVIPTPLASAIITDISNFNNILSSDDTNVQLALNTLNSHTHPIDTSRAADNVVVKLSGDQTITGTKTFSNDVIVTGNLTINGTTTNINTTNLVVEDKNIIIGDVATPSNTTADGGGITLKGATDKTINWVNSTGRWTSNQVFGAPNYVSTVATGTQPYATTSTTVNTNLNADLLDGLHSSSFIPYNDVLMPTNPFGGRRLYINSIDNAMHSADKKWFVTATRHSKVHNSENYPLLNSGYRSIYTYTTSDNITFTLNQTPLPTNVVVYLTITSSGTRATQVASAPTTNTQYTYNNSTGAIVFGLARPDNIIYVYAHPDVPQYLDSPSLGSVTTSTFFDGNYEGGQSVATTEYLKVRVTPGNGVLTNFSDFIGYPYGTLYLSHYYDGAPEVEYLRTYNYSFAGHGIGWKQTTFTNFINNNTNVNYISQASNDIDFGRSVMEFIVVSKSDKTANLNEIDWRLSRPNLSSSGSTVTKFGQNKLYSNLLFGQQTNLMELSATGGWIRTSDNTASFPAYSFLNDTNTGIFRPADDTLALSTGGVERLRIMSDGHLRIGSSNTENYISFRGTTGDNPGGFDHTYIGERIYNPSEGSELLIFKGNDIDAQASGADRVRVVAGEFRVDTYTTGVSGSFSSVATNVLNTNRFFIGTTGNIGIGTSAPLNKLEVRVTGGDSNDGIMITRSDATTVTNEILGGIGFDSTDGNVPSSILEASAYIAAFAAEDHSVGDKGGYLTFGTAPIDQDDDTVSLERMRITTDGNVVIGTTTPSAYGKLTVANGIATNSLYASDRVVFGDVSGYDTPYIAWNGSSTPYQLRIADPAYEDPIIIDTEAVSITANKFIAGSIGIGTSSPAVSLDVAGQGRFVSATFPPLSVERTSTQTNTNRFVSRFLHTTSGDMADGFGSQITFDIRDSANVINTIGTIGATRSGADGSGRLIFNTFTTETENERMTILPSGNVGIGTSSPSSNLEVISSTSSPETGNGILRFSTSTGTDDRGNKIGAVSGTNGYSYWQSIRPGVANDGIISLNPTGGNVGIGTTTPSYKFEVNGLAKFDGTPSNEQTANYTLVLSDKGKVLRINSASARTVTIPLDASVAFPIDTEIAILRYGTGTVSISPTAGVTLQSADGERKIKNRYGSVALKKIAEDEWVLVGSLEA